MDKSKGSVTNAGERKPWLIKFLINVIIIDGTAVLTGVASIYLIFVCLYVCMYVRGQKVGPSFLVPYRYISVS